jgi:hypothetical protein
VAFGEGGLAVLMRVCCGRDPDLRHGAGAPRSIGWGGFQPNEGKGMEGKFTQFLVSCSAFRVGVAAASKCELRKR